MPEDEKEEQYQRSRSLAKLSKGISTRGCPNVSVCYRPLSTTKSTGSSNGNGFCRRLRSTRR